MTKTWGPRNTFCNQLHADKYRQRGESFRDAMTRIASTLSDSDAHFQAFRDILLEMRFMPGGRVQSAMGSTRATSAHNCFVSGEIADSYTRGHGSIMERAKEAADTMRLGGGIGYDFSTLRPRGDMIRTLESQASGPVSFIPIFDAVGLATSSSGHRRGAQMAVLRIDHPDIEEFVRSKQTNGALTGFNISVAVTDEFMQSLTIGGMFKLRWNKRVYREIDARALWDLIMRTNYDWSEPGVLFIDRINNQNNLRYCETISATNPCGEQPLPPYGACLLGSINLTKYLYRNTINGDGSPWEFDYRQFHLDIPHIVRAMDNVVDRARYPLHEQQQEAQLKRRMGLGITGAANTIEAMGYPYGTHSFCSILRNILSALKNAAYKASALLAREKGAFPAYDRDPYLASPFLQSLEDEVWETIRANGIRNSHLTSIAPTGTISLAADNISSGIEPVFAHSMTRLVYNAQTMAQDMVVLNDYGCQYLGVKGRTAAECSATDHLSVLKTCAPHVDSAISKTCNIPQDYCWDDFKALYMEAYEAGCKGCTTHRNGNLRGSILTPSGEESAPPIAPGSDSTCEIDPATGRRSCE